MILFFVERYNDFAHGISKNNEYLIKKFQHRFDEVRVVSDYSLQNSIIKPFFGYICLLLTLIQYPVKTIYYVPSATARSRMTLLLFWIVIKILRKKLKFILQFHRSDIKDYKQTGLHHMIEMKTLVTIVFISREMEKNFNKNFENNFFTLTLPNLLYQKPLVTEPSNNPSEHENIKISFIGNVSNEKGIIRFRDICAALEHSYSLDIKVNIYGKCINGYTQAQLRLDFSANVINYRYNGPYNTRELATIIEDNDIFIIPSYNEGDPLIIHELIAHRANFFCSDVGFIPEFLGKDFPNYITTNGNFEAKHAAEMIYNRLCGDQQFVPFRNEEILATRASDHSTQLDLLLSHCAICPEERL